MAIFPIKIIESSSRKNKSIPLCQGHSWKDKDADFHVIGKRWFENGYAAPFDGYLCKFCLEYMVENEELTVEKCERLDGSNATKINPSTNKE